MLVGKQDQGAGSRPPAPPPECTPSLTVAVEVSPSTLTPPHMPISLQTTGTAAVLLKGHLVYLPPPADFITEA